MPFNRQTILSWINRQADNQQQNIWIFTCGAVLFFIGMGLILFADHSLAPSLAQELIALFGLLLSIVGGSTAAFGYISLSVLRFFRLATNDQPKQAKSPATDIHSEQEVNKAP